MKFVSERLRLYAVTDRHWLGEKTLISQVELALRGGATLIQLREKDMAQQAFLAEALAISLGEFFIWMSSTTTLWLCVV